MKYKLTFYEFCDYIEIKHSIYTSIPYHHLSVYGQEYIKKLSNIKQQLKQIFYLTKNEERRNDEILFFLKSDEEYYKEFIEKLVER